jgi:hypothetical protein
VDFLLLAIKITKATKVLTFEAKAIRNKETKFCVIIYFPKELNFFGYNFWKLYNTNEVTVLYGRANTLTL